MMPRHTSLHVCLLWVLALALLAGCGEPLEIETGIIGAGGSRPELVAAGFFDDLNEALQDPNITKPETRRTWAERLASYFAPSERVDQRKVIEKTLGTFAFEAGQLAEDQRLIVEVVYTNVELVEQIDNLARVRLTDGRLRLQRLRVSEDDQEQILFEQERPLAEVIGQEDNIFPVLRVNGRWFITER